MASVVEYLPQSDSLYEGAILELQRQFTPDIGVSKTYNIVEKISLSTFVETTSNIILEPWQHHLCNRLQKLTHQKGQRIMVHKPPQHGGSIIVSQRLPAYLIADCPDTRIKLAGFNIEHAAKFGGINKNIMTSSQYKSMFADHADELYVPTRASDTEFSTKARKQARDAQSSFMALGLQTGFVGQGAETLIIDDPYASPQAALSKAIRDSTWLFWTGSAKVRINENTNVIVMFHRYGEEDFAGQLISEEGLVGKGGQWELISYRAEWDGDIRPEVGGPDPINRKIGEYLSPRLARQPGYYKEQKRQIVMWQSQFQGKPSKQDGSFFKITRIQIIPRCPVKIIKICRAWDIASSEEGDYTVGILMGLGEDDRVYILDIVRFREDTDERNKAIKHTAQLDRLRFPEIIFRLPQDPAAAGKDMALSFRKLLKGFNLKIEIVKGDKELRADPFSQYVNAGLVFIVYNGPIGEQVSEDWVTPYLAELRKFPNSTKKDQVDASSDSFAEIALEVDTPPGEDFDTINGSAVDQAEVARRLLAGEAETEEELLAEVYAEMHNIDIMSPVDQGLINGYKNESYNSSTGDPHRNERDISKLSTHHEREAARKTTFRRKGYSRTNIYRS